jgi:hypothetical protein
MRAAAATLLLMTALAVALLAASTQTAPEAEVTPDLYERGVFLTVGTPDVPTEAAALLVRLRVAHTRDQLEAMLTPETRVIVYDCSAWTEVTGGYLSFQLAQYVSIVGINVSRGNLLDPTGCEQGPTVPAFFSLIHRGRSDHGSCGGSSSSTLEHDGFGGKAFELFLERELKRSSDCGF